MNYTVATSLRFEGEPVKGSRFIVDVAPAADEDAARRTLAAARASFADASHHCWAWRIASPAIDRASDDGEPSGSAGRPILAQLTGRNLLDVAVVVTRYFGGTKLGVGGLVRAYGGAAGNALDTVALQPWVAEQEIRFTHDYASTDAIERLIHESDGTIIDRLFAAEVDVQLRLPVDAIDAFTQALADLTSGAAIIKTDEH